MGFDRLSLSGCSVWRIAVFWRLTQTPLRLSLSKPPRYG